MESASQQNSNVTRPKNIWEVEKRFFCPIIGHCLATGEQKHLLKKCTKGTEAANRKLTGIDLHEFFVMAITEDTPIARKVQSFLEMKYAKDIAKYKDLTYREWLSLADSLCNPEQYGAYIWITATCFAGSYEQCAQVYGKIHMYSHEALNQLRKCHLSESELRKENSSLTGKFADVKAQLKWAQKEVVRLKGECARLEAEAATYRQDREYVHEHVTELRSLHESRASLERLLAEQVDANRALRKKNDSLSEQLRQAEEAFVPLKDDIAALIRSLQSQQECCEDCERISLCRKRVLLVGGLSRMVGVYREIVEKLGGRFDFHDGCCHNGNDHLRRQILQSDLVICPVDINSHAACLEVKRVCKRSQKSFFMLRKSSLSTVYTTLVTAANSSGEEESSLEERIKQ